MFSERGKISHQAIHFLASVFRPIEGRKGNMFNRQKGSVRNWSQKNITLRVLIHWTGRDNSTSSIILTIQRSVLPVSFLDKSCEKKSNIRAHNLVVFFTFISFKAIEDASFFLNQVYIQNLRYWLEKIDTLIITFLKFFFKFFFMNYQHGRPAKTCPFVMQLNDVKVYLCQNGHWEVVFSDWLLVSVVLLRSDTSCHRLKSAIVNCQNYVILLVFHSSPDESSLI